MRAFSRLRLAVGAGLLLGAGTPLGIGATAARAATPAKAPAGPAVVALRVQPAALALENRRDARRVLVSGRTKSGEWIDLSDAAKLTPVAGGVSVDRDGYIHPVKPGAARVLVAAGGQKVELPVSVRSVANPPISFVRE